ELVYSFTVALEIDDNVISISVIIDFISKTSFAHFINFFNLRSTFSQNIVETLNQFCLYVLLNIWSDDIHNFILSHPLHILLVLAAPYTKNHSLAGARSNFYTITHDDIGRASCRERE